MTGMTMSLGAALVGALLCLGSAAEAQSAARFRLEVVYDWSVATHPFEFPADPHFSDLFGITHDDRYVLFADGQTASGGIELMAENGRGGILRAEWDEAARKQRVGHPFSAEGVVSPGRRTAEFTAEADHPYMSFVTMLAPSPDWFTGVSALPLTNKGAWIDAAEAMLWVWDAGTDGGATYAAENDDTQPRAVVRLLASPHVLDDGGLRPVGRVIIRRLADAAP
jgi:hypothetical protein